MVKELLTTIIASPLLHGKWINTLSFLENCGARKLAACEHPTKVKEEMLKHASEEFRHAYYLKRQIAKVTDHPLPHYYLHEMIGGFASLHYLQSLDLLICRYLSKASLNIKELAYLFTTYAIEKRAGHLYPLYHELLKSASSPVSVKSILLEEEEHLAEIEEELTQIPSSMQHCHAVCALENDLYRNWLTALQNDIDR
jgi:hypothetical protein